MLHAARVERTCDSWAASLSAASTSSLLDGKWRHAVAVRRWREPAGATLELRTDGKRIGPRSRSCAGCYGWGTLSSLGAFSAAVYAGRGLVLLLVYSPLLLAPAEEEREALAA